MLKITLKNLYSLKTASLPDDIKLPLSGTEDAIFSFIREATAITPGSPVSRVAGGWVRDRLLGKESKDIDITVEGMKGVDFANHLKQYAQNKYGPNQNIIGTIKDTEARPEQVKNLAVAFLRIYGEDIEILNLRGNEVYEEGSRNPISTDFNATPEEDAFRRDLTINSLFYNIQTGRIEDFTGKGYDDLATMTLRTPLDPEQTFKDDPLRLLRVLRFHSRYGNSKIAPEVIQAMHNPEVQQMITKKMHDRNYPMGIVTERTAEEFRKILVGQQPEKAVRLMYESGLLQGMLNLPESFHPLSMDQMNKHHALTVIDHTLEVLKNVNQLATKYDVSKDDRMMLNAASIFHDLGKLDPRSHKNKDDGSRGYSGDPNNPEGLTHQQSSADIFGSFADSLGLNNKEKKKIHGLVLKHMDPHAHVEGDVAIPSDKQLRKFKTKNEDYFLLYLHAMADSMSKSTEPSPERTIPYEQNLQRLQDPALFPQEISQKQLLDGRKIMNIVGLPPAPPPGVPKSYINLIQDRIQDEQFNNPNITENDAIQIVQNMISSGELSQYYV